MQDEMRAGTRTECKRRWTLRGRRPVCKVKLGYAFTYLYAAIAPATGKLIALLLPDMTKASFALFVDHFKKETKALHGSHSVVLIADGAGAHQSSVCEQRGIAFARLPTACPELNVAERFFEALRKELSNRVFHTIGQLENYLCKVLKKYFDHPEMLVQLCHYPYIRNA
ncbi:MAG TPA: transposase [Nitrososphaera sp.]|jgi:transposase|nr:transposase [Nitrososphaera sp.]